MNEEKKTRIHIEWSMKEMLIVYFCEVKFEKTMPSDSLKSLLMFGNFRSRKK